MQRTVRYLSIMPVYPIPSFIPPLESAVKYGKRLIGGSDAVLAWTGEVFHLRLVSGEVIFELPPAQITRVRDDQRATLNFKTGSRTHQVYFPEVADQIIGALGDGTTIGAGRGVARSRTSALESPVNSWLELLRATGIRVLDNTYVPPSNKKIVLISLWVTGGCILLAVVIAVIGSLLH